jgi:ketosteroid isomerase-like protein
LFEDPSPEKRRGKSTTEERGSEMETASARYPRTDEWLVGIFRTIDSMDAAGLAEAFTEDGTFRFGNNDTIAGREQIRQYVEGFFSSIAGLSHHFTGMWSGRWEMGDVHIVESDVTYTRKDGTKTQPLPATSTLRMKRDRIRDYRIFIDISPLFASPA